MRGSISVFKRGQRWMKTEACVPHTVRSRTVGNTVLLAQRSSQTLCVLGNHRVWYSQRREGPCGRNQRAGACPFAGARYSSSFSPSSSSFSPRLCALSPPPPVTVCVPTCPGQTTPSEEFTLSPSSSFHFLFFFLASWPSCFLHRFFV